MLKAIPIVKNKFWLVTSNDGNKVGSVKSSDRGLTYMHDNEEERFATIKLLKDKYNISFETYESTNNNVDEHEVYGYSTGKNKPYNQLWHVKLGVPVFTKEEKSRSFYCAGYYLIKERKKTKLHFCPKIIMLERNEFEGPLKSALGNV
jgi:hypothetical protein